MPQARRGGANEHTHTHPHTQTGYKTVSRTKKHGGDADGGAAERRRRVPPRGFFVCPGSVDEVGEGARSGRERDLFWFGFDGEEAE